MVRPPYLVLNKSEWNRLQKQGSPEKPNNDKKEHLKVLTEQSQDWIKTWPDTIAGHIAQLEKQKKKQPKDDIAFMKAYAQKLKQDNTAEAIKRARQLIFQDSNYGKKLVSALLESRALDVRDAQIKLRKSMQQKADEMAKEEELSKKGGINYFHDNDAERVKINKQKALECIEVNKEMVALKKDKEMQTIQEEEKCAIKDEKLMKDVLEIEKKEKEYIKRCEKEALEQYEADLKEIAKIKAEEKKLDDALTEVQKRKQDRIKCKTQEVLKKTYQGRSDTKWSKDNYEKIDRNQREEKKRYDDFINKGIERYEKRIAKKELRDKLKEKEKQSSRYLLAQQNKIAGDHQTLGKKCENKCACDRQSLTLKIPGKPAKKTGIKRDVSPVTKVEIKSLQKSPKSPNSSEKNAEEKKPKFPFLEHRNKLTEDLRKREKVPTPWTGTKGFHVQFAQQADNVLKEIKHKHLARKVVDEYRKLNGLDAETLPVPNY